VSAGDAGARISWQPVKGATAYHLYIANEAGISASNYDLLLGGMRRANAQSPYVLSGLRNDTPYYFVVTSENAGGQTDPSLEVTATPRLALVSPANLTATAYEGEVILEWDPVVGAQQYKLYMAAEPGVRSEEYKQLEPNMAQTGVTSPYMHTGLTNGTTYYFSLVAMRGRSEGPPSTAIATPQMGPYTRIGSGGRALPDQSSNYGDAPWACVRSNQSGLTWEVKEASGGIRDSHNTYSWYTPSQTAQRRGAANGGRCPNDACDTHAYVGIINKYGLCGYHDWRLATRAERGTLVDASVPYPGATINATYFPNTVNSFYWTATDSDHPEMAWFVYFGSGYDYYDIKPNGKYVRLVRGQPTAPLPTPNAAKPPNIIGR
jgi:hypothetical protein